MQLNKSLVGIASVVVAVGIVAVAWPHAATPTVGLATATPAYVVVNTPTAVLVTTTITDSTLLVNGVNLLQTNASGKTVTTMGVMHDDGLAGDLKAGDKVFSYRLTVNQATVGQVYYRASVAFRGVLQRVLSNLVSITIDPFPLPPDPGEAGKLTLEGIDSDNDGVRDDLQRWASLLYRDNRDSRLALLQIAKGAQQFIQASSPEQAAVADDVRNRGKDCMESFVGPYGLADVSKRMTLELLNTAERSAAYARATKLLGARVYTLTSESMLRSACEF